MPYLPSSTSHATGRFVRRLGPHHFAHLRACAEGLDVGDCARRYLGIEHGHEAVTAHQEAVDAVRSVARRRGEAAWRLVGLRLGLGAATARPSLADFVAEHGLEGFSEAEALALYEEAWPLDRKAARGQRLRQRQLELLRRLEALAAETPQPTDLVAGWFEEAIATRLITAGILTLGSLNAHIAAGGVWWRQLPAVGVAKARRIERHLGLLLPRQAPLPKLLFALSLTPSLFRAPSAGDASSGLDGLVFDAVSDLRSVPLPRSASSTPRPPSLLAANSDLEAVQSWIQARAGSEATVKVYQREATRLLLWLQYERGGRTLAQMQVDDCSAFMAFLQNIPPQWISRARAAPGTPGWAPFRGPLVTRELPPGGGHRRFALCLAAVSAVCERQPVAAGEPENGRRSPQENARQQSAQ
ncbi:MAG: phage integrase family protein [Polaromonas sp.]|nr:phage integrase family protein [Polaromonas sp.]